MRTRENPIPLIIAISKLLLILALLSGEVICVVRAVKCNWEPIGKAELIYTVSAVTGLGVIVGWIDIEDN